MVGIWKPLAVLLCLMHGAYAYAGEDIGPSFDCAKASESIDTLVCGDSQLIALDRAMAAAYPLAISGAGPLKDGLVQDQREWLRRRGRGCRPSTEGTILPSADPAAIPCLRQSYSDRVAELKSYAEAAADPGRKTQFENSMIDAAFTYMDPQSGTAEKVFRAGKSLKAKLGLAMVLRLVPADGRDHSDEVDRLLQEIAETQDPDQHLGVELPHRYDRSVKGLVPYLQDVGIGVRLSCKLIERYPPLVRALGGYFGSSRDNLLPTTDCLPEDYAFPASAKLFTGSIERHFGNVEAACERGTIRFARDADLRRIEVEAWVLPRFLLDEVKPTTGFPDWGNVQKDPLRGWSYQSPWNYYSYTRLHDLFVAARRDLAEHYQKRFGLTARDAVQAAQIGLLLPAEAPGAEAPQQHAGSHIPTPGDTIRISTLDPDAKPSLSELLAHTSELPEDPDPILSFAVLRPSSIAPLLAAHAKVNSRNAYGETPLMTAARFDSLETVQLLLNAGAEVDAVTSGYPSDPGGEDRVGNDLFGEGDCGGQVAEDGGRTALMFAAASASLPVVKALAAAPADRSKRDEKGLSAFDHLVGKGPTGPNPSITGADLEEAKALLSPH